jgi:hypothetical protein
VVEARSIPAFDSRSGAFLAKRYYDFKIRNYPQLLEKLRYTHRKSGEGWIVRRSGALGVEQFSPLRKWP